MKILFFSHGKRANGGAERCLLDLVKGLKQARESWEIYVVFPAKDELWEMTRPYLSGYAFIRQPWWLVRPKKRNWRKRLLFNLKKNPAICKTRDYIREIKPDITITNTLATPIGAIASHAENIPHDWFIHEIPELARNLTYLFCEDSCLEKISSLSQRILVPSDFAGKYYTNKLSSPEKIDVVYQSVEVNAKRTEPGQSFTIGMLGNFEPNKGQHIAIEALREVVKKYPDTRLLLIGGNNSRYAQELEKRITEYNPATKRIDCRTHRSPARLPHTSGCGFGMLRVRMLRTSYRRGIEMRSAGHRSRQTIRARTDKRRIQRISV